jgi:hypothetical protein
MSERRTLHMLTPHYEPMGGVVKIFDYVGHARALGYAVNVWSEEPFDPERPLFAMPSFAALLDDPEVSFTMRPGFTVGPDDLVMVSLPRNLNLAEKRLAPGMSPERIVHIIQNTRHVNTAWLRGEGTRVLTRPGARISISQIVADTIEPWLDPRGLHRVINLGHDAAYFRKERSGGLRGEGPQGQVKVAHTAWKSDIGDRVEHALESDGRFTFRAIRGTASWPELRELYHWADVFLCAPGPQEGMYLPGLEAMAAGAVVVTPDVEGNMAYCRPGHNCVLVGYDRVQEYADALRRLAEAPDTEIDSLRSSGHAMTAEFSLDAERRAFAAFLDELWVRIREREGRRAS